MVPIVVVVVVVVVPAENEIRVPVPAPGPCFPIREEGAFPAAMTISVAV